MNFLAQVHIYCFLLSYLVSLGCEILLVFRRQIASVRIAIFAFSIAGFVAHTAFLVTRSQRAGLPPLLSSNQDWLLVLAWLGSLLYIILMLTHRQIAHGLFMLPAILLLVIVAVFVSSEGSGNLEADAMRRWGKFSKNIRFNDIPLWKTTNHLCVLSVMSTLFEGNPSNN